PNVNFLLITILSENDTLVKIVNISEYEVLDGLYVHYVNNVSIGKTVDITANITSGTEVKFEIEVYMQDENHNATVTSKHIADKAVIFSFTPSLEGNYCVKITASSLCGETRTESLNIFVTKAEESRPTTTSADVDSTAETSTQPVLNLCSWSPGKQISQSHEQNAKSACVKDWNEGPIVTTEIKIDLSSQVNGVYLDIHSKNNISIYDIIDSANNVSSQLTYPEENQTILIIVLSCFQSCNENDIKCVTNASVLYILHNVSQTNDIVLYIKNNYTVDVYLELLTSETEFQDLLISAGEWNSINFGKTLIYNAPTLLTFVVNDGKENRTKNLNLIFKESLSGLYVDYKDTVTIGEDSYVTASVYSGSDVNIDLYLLSTVDDKAFIQSIVTSSLIFQYLFQPSVESDYTFLVNATSSCEQNLIEIFTLKAEFPEICHRIEPITNYTVEDIETIDINEPICVKDWNEDQISVNEINVDLTSENIGGYVYAHQDYNQVKNEILSHFDHQGVLILGEIKSIFMIILSCFPNMDQLGNKTVFNNSVFILHNSSDAFQNVIFIKNTYPVDVYLELFNETSSELIFTPRNGFAFINFGNYLYYNVPRQLNFKVNTSKQYLSKNISLIYKEGLLGVDVEYMDAVLVDNEYNITATVLSGSDVHIDFSILFPVDFDALIENDITNETNKIKEMRFKPSYKSKYTILVHASSFCKEALVVIINISASFPELCNSNETAAQQNYLLKESIYFQPLCIKDSHNDQILITEINLDISTSSYGFINVLNGSIESMQTLISELNYQISQDKQTIMMIVLSCHQNVSHQTYDSIFNDTIYLLHNISHTFDSIVYIKNDYRVKVYLALTNTTDSESILILPGDTEAVNLGNSLVYEAPISFNFKVETNEGFVSRNLNWISKESLSGLEMDYSDVAIIGEDYNIKATVFSGSDFTIDFNLVTPIDMKALIKNTKSGNVTNDKVESVLFSPRYETNYTILVDVRTACMENLTETITISAEFTDLCSRNENRTAINNTNSFESDDLFEPVCFEDGSYDQKQITFINIDLTTGTNSGFIYGQNASTELIKNLTANVYCPQSEMFPVIVVFVLTCIETLKPIYENIPPFLEFNETLFMLHNVNNTCNRVFYFENNYLADVRLKLSDVTNHKDLMIESKSFSSIKLTKALMYDFTNLTFSLKTNKESHSMNLRLKYEALQDLQIQYKPVILVKEVLHITASVTSGCDTEFTFEIISPDNNDSILAYLEQEKPTSNLQSSALFIAFDELNFTIEVVAKSSCGENLSQVLIVSAMYPELCLDNGASVSISNGTKDTNNKSMPLCVMDLSEDNNTITQIEIDLTSLEPARFNVIQNASLALFHNLTCCNESTLGENVLYYNILLSCPKYQFDGLASNETIYILQTIGKISGNKFHVTNNYYNDTQFNVLNATLGAQDILPKSFMSDPITDQLQLSFELTYHRKFYKKNMTLRYHEAMTSLLINYEPKVLLGGEQCSFTALVETGVTVTFDFQILSPLNNKLLPSNMSIKAQSEDRVATLKYTPDFVGTYWLYVTATSFCREVLNRTIHFDAQLCMNSSPSTVFDIETFWIDVEHLPYCIMTWDDYKTNIVEFSIDLQLQKIIGYKHSINSTTGKMNKYASSLKCSKNDVPVLFNIVLTCFSTSDNNFDGNDSFWFNTSIYIIRRLNHPCEEVAVIYNNYTLDVKVLYTVLSVWKEIVIPPKNFSSVILDSSFSSGTLLFSFIMPHVQEPFVKNLSLIHFDELNGLNVSFVSDVLVGSLWNGTASINLGLQVKFSLVITVPERSTNRTNVNNITIEYITDKKAQFSFPPMDEGRYFIKVIATSACTEVLTQNITFFAHYGIQNSKLDLTYEITKHRKNVTVFYPKDIVAVALKVSDKILSTNTPTQPNCTISWGDNETLHEENVNLTPNQSSGYIYARSHSYTLPGQYTVDVECHNVMTRVSDTVNFTIVSPVDQADVFLAQSLVPFNAYTTQGIGNVRLIQNYIYTDYPDLIITLDFGTTNSNWNVTFVKDTFDYYYSYSEKGEYDIKTVIEAFGKRWLVRIKEPCTFTLVRYSANGTLNVKFFRDVNEMETLNKIFENGETVMNVTFNYTDETVREAKALIEVDNITEIESYKFETFIPCISTLDFFDVTYRNISKPLEAWLTTLPTISARAERTVDCNITDIFYMKWQVWKMENNSLTYNWIMENLTLEKNIVQNFAVIKSIGFYKIQLQILLDRKNENETDFMYLKVTYPPIAVKIKYGPFKQAKVGQDVTLDAESETRSLALSSSKTTTNKYFYTWTCYLLNSKEEITKYTKELNSGVSFVNLTKCNISLNSRAGKITVPTITFYLQDLVLFYVTAQDDDRSGSAGQVVEMTDLEPIDVVIECVWNCMDKLVKDSRTVFEANLTNANPKAIKEAQYTWSVIQYVLNGFTETEKQINSTNLSNSSYIFDTDGTMWEEGATYSISLEVVLDNDITLKAMKIVLINFKPYGGNCTVEPSEGNAAETPFLFTFPGWKDEGIRTTQNSSVDTNFGLMYEVYQETKAGMQLVYSGNEVSASTFLTEGKRGPNEDCFVTVYIFDMFRAKTSCGLTVKVNKVQSQSDMDIGSFFSIVDKKMKSVEMIGDPLKIAQRAASLSTFITGPDINLYDSTSTTTTTTTTKTAPTDYQNEQIYRINGFVETVSKVVQSDSELNSGQIQIFANSMAIVTTSTKQLTTKSMETASGAVKTLTNALKNSQSMELSALSPCLEGVHNIVSNILKVQDLESKKLFASLNKNYDGYTEEQMRILVTLDEEALKAREQPKFLQFDNIVENVTQAWDDVFNVVKKMTDTDGKYEADENKYKIALHKTYLEDVLNQTGMISPLGFTFEGISDNVEEANRVQVKAVKTVNIYTYGLNAKHINTEIVIGSVQQDNGNKLNLSNPTIYHETNETTDCSVENVLLVKPTLIQDDASQMFYHKFYYNEIFLHFCLKLRPTNPFLSYKLYLKMDLEPTDFIYDYRQTLSRDSFKACKGVCFEPGTFTKSGMIYIGLQPFIDTNETLSQENGRQKREATNNNLEAPYKFGISSAACLSWNNALKDWDTSKCKLSNLTGKVACTCDSGTEIINGMSFNFLPNTIHFATVFSKFDIKGQGLVLGVLISLYLLFTCIALWAHYMDRKAMFQWGVFPLSDNYAYDDYFYLITVHTGLRKSAGTTSNVSFDLSGEHGDSGLRRLSDGVKKGFPTGSVYHFVMACPRSLGELQFLKIWHDSTGKGSNSTWYLNRIDVLDLHTGKIFYFICDEWLAAEYGIEKMIETSNIEDLEKMKNLFFTNTKEHITDDHMWLSLFIRPQRSNFSRVERSLCCLAFLLLSMITSAMFYKDIPGIDRKQTKADLELGVIRLSYEQLFHSLTSAVITAVPMVFVMMVFRKARPKKNINGCLCNNKIKDNSKQLNENSDCLNKKIEKKKSCLPWMTKLECQLEALEKLLLLKPTADSMKGTWPHPLRYIAWVILFLAIITSSFFVLLYSMEWGKDVTETWMSTFFLTFLQSLLIVDPVKVVVISVIVSLLLRKANVKQVDQLDLELIAQVNKQYGVKEKFSQLDISYAPPLSKTGLKAATLRRKIHIMINRLMKEFIIHLMYLLIVASLCHANRSSQDYNMYRAIFQQVVNGSNSRFLEINSSASLLEWIPRNFTPWLFPDINLVSPDQTHFTKVNDLYRLGTPRIRQLRMIKEQCSLQKIKVKECVYGYSLSGEDIDKYCPGWTDNCSRNEDGDTDFTDAWIYTPSQDIWGLPIAGEYGIYGGGGYIVQLRFKNTALQIVKKLKRQMWIDRQTRAVFIEFTLYCPNTNHFAFVILLAEFMETGGILPYFSIYPFTVHYPPGALGSYLQVCQIVGTIFLFIGLLYVVFIFGMKKSLAFKDFWFLLDVIALVTGISAAAMMFLRLKFTKSVLSKIKEDRAQFVNMYHVIVWDSAYTLCLAILVAIGCFRLLKLASYSEKTMKVFVILSKAMALLPNFSIFLLLVLLSFVFFGWITFGTTSTYFKNFLSTTETMFTGILGKSSFKDTNSPISDRWMNILFFCMFVAFVVVFLINFFLAVLMNLLKKYDQKIFEGENTKVFIVLWDMFMGMMGSKRNPLDRLKGNDNDNNQEEDQEENEEEYPLSQQNILHFDQNIFKVYEGQNKKLMQMMFRKKLGQLHKVSEKPRSMLN
ncbi:polycystic kidney disease protein 1 2, partial [Biomphalaria glabrata]